MATKMIYWRELPPKVCVLDVGRAFVARLPKGRRATIFWHGQEGRVAQTHLKKLAAKGCRR